MDKTLLIFIGILNVILFPIGLFAIFAGLKFISDTIKESKEEKKSIISFIHDSFAGILTFIGGVALILAVIIFLIYTSGNIEVNIYKNITSVCYIMAGITSLITFTTPIISGWTIAFSIIFTSLIFIGVGFLDIHFSDAFNYILSKLPF